ncbi:MAG: peptidoglycan-binding protein [Clostridia bacterium]|nr:peptidoglycan-binding protein [Clostridia bacterium]
MEASEFTEYLKEQVRNHSIYVWGAQGQKKPTITEEWIRKREKTKRNADRAIAHWKKEVREGYGDVLRAFDCSGLGAYFFLKHDLIDHDVNAEGLRKMCSPITRSEVREGDMAFRISGGRAVHVGYAVAKDLLIEAKGRDVGVVESKISGWDRFGRPPFFSSRILKLRNPYMRGEDVRRLQLALKEQGYDPGQTDGIYGKKTERAVKRFQRANGLKADGIAGKQTQFALGLSFSD